MRWQPLFAALIVATLSCAMLAGCTGSEAPGPPSRPHTTGPLGSPANPLVVTCGMEAWPGSPSPPAPVRPGRRDLAVGPLYFAGALSLASTKPARYGYARFGRHGRFYKFGMVVRPGTTVTVTIGASQRGHAVIALAEGAATSVTYHACRRAGGFFAQGFAFTHPPYRGCVPVSVRIGNSAAVRNAVVSLFAGSCAAGRRGGAD